MFCRNCGTQMEDGASFCPSCGAKVEAENANQTPNGGQQAQYNGQPGAQPPYGQPPYGGQPYGNQPPYGQQPFAPAPQGQNDRNIAIAILLSFVTCGIYAIYWFITLTDEVNAKYGDPNATSGAMAFLFTLITCGIYGYFWAYKLGEKVDAIKGNPGGSSNVLFVVLEVFGLNIVNLALAQDAVNKY